MPFMTSLWSLGFSPHADTVDDLALQPCLRPVRIKGGVNLGYGRALRGDIPIVSQGAYGVIRPEPHPNKGY